MENNSIYTFKTGDYVEIVSPQFNFQGEKGYIAQIAGWLDGLAILDFNKVIMENGVRLTYNYDFKESYYLTYFTWRLAPADSPVEIEYEEITLKELDSLIDI